MTFSYNHFKIYIRLKLYYDKTLIFLNIHDRNYQTLIFSLPSLPAALIIKLQCINDVLRLSQIVFHGIIKTLLCSFGTRFPFGVH